MAEQKLLLGNVRGPQGPAGPNTVSGSTTTSGFENGHVLFNNNGKVGAKKLIASDVGALAFDGSGVVTVKAEEYGEEISTQWSETEFKKFGPFVDVYINVHVKSYTTNSTFLICKIPKSVQIVKAASYAATVTSGDNVAIVPAPARISIEDNSVWGVIGGAENYGSAYIRAHFLVFTG